MRIETKSDVTIYLDIDATRNINVHLIAGTVYQNGVSLGVGTTLVFHLTPDEARTLAPELIRLADERAAIEKAAIEKGATREIPHLTPITAKVVPLTAPEFQKATSCP